MAGRFGKFHSPKSLADLQIGALFPFLFRCRSHSVEVIFPSTSAMRTVFDFFYSVFPRSGSRKKGQTLVEYALILAVITIVLILVFSLLSARLVVIFSAITNLLDTAQSSH
jgi:Flp pilus assembly pilin Flp